MKVYSQGEDPFVMAKKEYDMDFLQPLLVERIEAKMRAERKFEGNPDFYSMMAAQVGNQLRGALAKLGQSLYSSGSYEEATQITRDHPQEYKLLERAFSMRKQGKSDSEILAALQQEDKTEAAT